MNNNTNWPLIGNENIVDFLSKSIENNKIAGSYIFLGNKNLGKTTIAKFFAKILFCQSKTKNPKTGHVTPCNQCQSCQKMDQKENDENLNDFSSLHSDCYLIRKDEEKKDISVDQIRQLIYQLNTSSFLNSYKIGIIKDANDLNVYASNALLKTLEEPKNKVVIILIMENIKNIPKTIFSRSQIINFRSVPANTIYDFLIKEYNTNRDTAINITRVSMNSPALAIKFLQDKKYYDSHLEIAGTFVNFFNQTINEQFESIENLLGSKSKGQELVKISLNIVNIWNGVLRDLFLLHFGNDNLIQNKPLTKKMEKIKINSNLILSIFKALDDSFVQLKNNVNPKFVLNNFVLKIIN